MTTNAALALSGKFFHTTKTCAEGRRRAQWQGHIIGAPTSEVLLIETFDWIIGEPYGQELINVADFVARQPVLYQDAEEMKFHYEYGRFAGDDRCPCLSEGVAP